MAGERALLDVLEMVELLDDAAVAFDAAGFPDRATETRTTAEALRDGIGLTCPDCTEPVINCGCGPRPCSVCGADLICSRCLFPPDSCHCTDDTEEADDGR